MPGDHPIKNWSSTQSVIALSTGEAELYAIIMKASSGLGVQSILHELGIHIDLCVFTDATTGKAMPSRRGLGKVRHIAVNELWIQEHVQNKTITTKEIKNKFNPADLLTKYLSKARLPRSWKMLRTCPRVADPQLHHKWRPLQMHPFNWYASARRVRFVIATIQDLACVIVGRMILQVPLCSTILMCIRMNGSKPNVHTG